MTENAHDATGEAPAKGKPAKHQLTLQEAVTMPAIDVPDAGRLFLGGLSRNASYAAARVGQIQTITVGRRIKALTKPLAESVGMQVKF